MIFRKIGRHFPIANIINWFTFHLLFNFVILMPKYRISGINQYIIPIYYQIKRVQLIILQSSCLLRSDTFIHFNANILYGFSKRKFHHAFHILSVFFKCETIIICSNFIVILIKLNFVVIFYIAFIKQYIIYIFFPFKIIVSSNCNFVFIIEIIIQVTQVISCKFRSIT